MSILRPFPNTNSINQNEKYGDIVVLNNFYFIEQTLSVEMFPTLSEFLKYASERVMESEAKYVLWMVTYELSSLAELATRLEGGKLNNVIYVLVIILF